MPGTATSCAARPTPTCCMCRPPRCSASTRWRCPSSICAAGQAVAASMRWWRCSAPRHEPARVRAFVAELRKLEMLQLSGSLRPINPASVKVSSYPLSTVVLNVNTGCNLSCTYCYKEDLEKPANGRKMDFVTAARSVDLLLKAGAARERVEHRFLRRRAAHQRAADSAGRGVCRSRGAARAGKTMDFSLTTNATLLTPALDRLLRCAPLRHLGIHGWTQGHARPASQERRRPRHLRCRRAQGALAARALSSRPVGARVTLGGGTTEVEAIHAHLAGRDSASTRWGMRR